MLLALDFRLACVVSFSFSNGLRRLFFSDAIR